jgi:DNA-binding transcriptional MocR family regulator
MDKEGVLPDALEKACRIHKPKAVYLVPTQQNPTTATLRADRRKAVAAIIRKFGTPLIEDDVYGPLESSMPPIATLVPELTYLAVSVAKCISPGLRVAYLLAPDAAAEQSMRAALQATMQMPQPLMVALMTHWLRAGVADEIIRAVRNEAIARQQLAARLLKGIDYVARPTSHHIWLPLPANRGAPELLSYLSRRGLAVVGEDAFAVIDTAPRGIRVSLGAARNRSELSSALQVLSGAMSSFATVQIV